MLARYAIALLVCWPTIVLGQVTGRFYLEKETFAAGEPVFLYFEVTNSGTETQNVYKADPYSFCSGYQIHVSSDFASRSSCAPMVIGGSCASSDAPVEPGKTVTERILLNYEHKIGSHGQYEIEAERNLAVAPASEDFFRAKKGSLEVHTRLAFNVDESGVWGATDLQPWVEQLHSTEPAQRQEAARTLASLAPKFLEDILLSFSDDPELRQWAPLAFQQLNTPRSLAALAKLLDTTEPGTYEHMKAADFLAESGDPKWFPRLLEVAQKNSKIANYVFDAAESGGDQILPTLQSMLQSSDTEFARPIAISALGYSGSRSVIPILLALLRDLDMGTSQRALYGLRQLTHRDIGGDHWFDNPQSQYSVWNKWWNAEGARAPIYKVTECNEIKPLR
jgi:HEAT repeats